MLMYGYNQIIRNMKTETYIPQPVDTSEVKLSEEEKDTTATPPSAP